MSDGKQMSFLLNKVYAEAGEREDGHEGRRTSCSQVFRKEEKSWKSVDSETSKGSNGQQLSDYTFQNHGMIS